MHSLCSRVSNANDFFFLSRYLRALKRLRLSGLTPRSFQANSQATPSKMWLAPTMAKSCAQAKETKLTVKSGLVPDGARPRVLVVDDEESITDLVATALRYEGFEVEIAAGGRAALRLATSFRPHLIVLDVMLPDLDGFEVQRRLVADRLRVPILFLTARDATEDKVRGLTVGADDYVTKPFSLEEVVARIRSVLRRTSGTVLPAPSTAQLAYGDIVLDDDTHEVWEGDRQVDLSPTEFNLLRYFLQNPAACSASARPSRAWCPTGR